MTHIGRCLCGAVELEVTGEPVSMGYCHCATCRSWSTGPIAAFSIWKAEAVTITSGAEHIRTFQKTARSHRKFCERCGTQLMLAIPALGLVDIFITTLPTLPFEPAVHLNYAETILPIRDGLPKLKDFPAEIGGTGELLPE